MHTNTHLFLHLAAATATLATHVTLDRQCWIEHTLTSSAPYTSRNGQEYISLIPAYLQKQRKDYTPWSHTPICTPKLPSINNVLCIYTSTSFSNGRGISIFTTPSAAKDFAALPAFQNLSVFQDRAINVPTNTSRPTSIANKGIGLLSTKPLKFANRITSYTPVFLAYLEANSAPWTARTGGAEQSTNSPPRAAMSFSVSRMCLAMRGCGCRISSRRIRSRWRSGV